MLLLLVGLVGAAVGAVVTLFLVGVGAGVGRPGAGLVHVGGPCLQSR